MFLDCLRQQTILPAVPRAFDTWCGQSVYPSLSALLVVPCANVRSHIMPIDAVVVFYSNQ